MNSNTWVQELRLKTVLSTYLKKKKKVFFLSLHVKERGEARLMVLAQ